MSNLSEKELISQFDAARRSYIKEEQALRSRYFKTFQHLLAQIANIRRMKEVR